MHHLLQCIYLLDEYWQDLEFEKECQREHRVFDFGLY
jgi:hypothetical protein